MIGKNHFFRLLLFLFSASMAGQSIATPSIKDLTTSMGTEGTYLHYSHNVLFTGESLHYKLYALDNKEEGFSKKSKIAYVELLDQNGKRKIVQKVKLTNGTGQGDFFLPTDLESGYYTLTAYTRYMLNWPANTFYNDQVIVINPYTNNQQAFRSSGEADTAVAASGYDTKMGMTGNGNSRVENSLNISLDQDRYNSRDLVQLSITAAAEFFGEYSISVRRIPVFLKYKERISPFEYRDDFSQIKPIAPGGLKYLPELRGELVSGKLHAEDQNQTDLFKKVIFSIPGKGYELALAQTDKDGRFSFSLDSDNFNSGAFFQVVGAGSQNYRVEIIPDPTPAFKAENRPGFRLDPVMQEEIKARSVHNQIENAYFELKPDTVAIANDFTPFYGSASTTYHLDEYTRFSTFRETLVEIISDAWIDRDKDGNESIFVRDFAYTSTNYGYKPLVIIDGIILQDHQDLIGYNARKIKSVSLVRNQYHLGGQLYQGIFDVVTFENDFAGSYTSPQVMTKELLRPSPLKKYYRQTYGKGAENTTIPDFRHQLLWQPDLKISQPQTTIQFFTSDVKGDFELVIEGFTKDMDPIKVTKRFSVE